MDIYNIVNKLFGNILPEKYKNIVILELARLNTLDRLSEYGFDVDYLCKLLIKYNSIISGSFMLMNLLNLNTRHNDIDIFLFDSHFLENRNGLHEIEKYIIENVCSITSTKDEYSTNIGIQYTRTYYKKFEDINTNAIKINIIVLNMDCQFYINEMFDLDCCKIMFDGESVKTKFLLDILKKESFAKINTNIDTEYLCMINQFFPMYECKIFLDLFNIDDKLWIKKYGNKFLMYKEKIHPGSVNINYKLKYTNYIIKFSNVIKLLQQSIDKETSLQIWGKDYNLKEMKQYQHLLLHSYIRTILRIEKYKNRGIKSISITNYNDFIILLKDQINLPAM